MSAANSSQEETVEIRKYPNRRYYDSTHSCHVTLEAIRDMVRDGQSVRVVDSKTSEDITARVLTQIILEHEADKLGVFPVELLTQMIRFDDKMVSEFIKNQIQTPMTAFSQFYDQWMKTASGMGGTPFFQQGFPWGASGMPGMNMGAGLGGGMNDMWKSQLEELQKQVEALQGKVDSKDGKPKQ